MTAALPGGFRRRSSVALVRAARPSSAASIVKEGIGMKVMDERAEEMLVAPDPKRASIELHTGGTAAEDPLIIRLTREEARRLAALILFQAARLDRPRHGWGVPYDEHERQSA
jgi:hypothetical protein